MNKLTQILTGMTAGAALYFAPAPATAQVISGDSTVATLFGQKCEPGKNYTVTADGGETLEVTCPIPSARKKKASCESQFDGDGFCGEKNLVSVFGLDKDTYKKGFCLGESLCYDAGEITLTGDIEDLDSKVTDLETKVTDLGTKVDGLKSTEITEIERFALTLLGKQCQDDYNRLKKEIADYQMAVQGQKDAEQALKDYTGSQPTPEADTANLTPQGLLKENTAMPSSAVDKEEMQRLLSAVKNAELGVQKAKQTMDQDVEALKLNGCGYTSKPAETKGVEFVARALGIVDLEGNLGGMAEFGAMIPAGRGFYFGPVVRAGYLGASDSSSETRKFPTATEYIGQTEQRNVLAGAGLVAGFEVFDNALALELEAGASLSEERTTRDMTVGNDTRTYDSGEELSATPVVGAGLNGKLSDRFGWSAKTLYEPVKESLQFLAGLGIYF